MARFIQFVVLQLSILLMVGTDASKPGNKGKPNVATVVKNETRVAAVSTIVSAAVAFKATLNSDQITSLQKTFTKDLAQAWSNLPCGSNCRNGIQFSTLTAVQLAAANLVIQSAAGTAANEGFDEYSKIRLADDYLKKYEGTSRGDGPANAGTQRTAMPEGPGGVKRPEGSEPRGPGRRGGPGGPGGYSSGIYFIAFLNEPSTSGPWMLQFGGHHYAANIAFNHGEIIGVTPIFEGLEPTSFTVSDTTYAPMDQERDAMANMLGSLTASQLLTAKSTLTFSDVVLGPGRDGHFPATKTGLAVSGLSAAQKALVLEAIKPWLRDAQDTSAAKLLSIYEKELDRTFITFAGSADAGVPDSFLKANADYVRIDGPSVWIEFVCQSGIVIPGKIHYHSVWRDHLHDYGNYLANN